MSIAEVALGIVGLLIVLLITAWSARRGGSQASGLLLGVLAGVVSTFAVGAALGFLSHLLPLGQIDFWLAGIWDRLHAPH